MQSKITHFREQNAVLRQHLFGRNSEQTVDPTTPQLALFDEAESVDEAAAEEVITPINCRAKRQPLPTERGHQQTLPRVN
jgi:hypothetical protein